jgi:sugar phosphate isomerase/epimerase
MHLGLSSFTYGWAIGIPGYPPTNPWRVADLLQQVVAYKLDTLQIGDNLPLHLFTSDELQKLKSTADSHGIRLEIGARGLTEKNLDLYLGLAEMLRAKLIRFVTDGDGYEPDPNQIIRILKSRQGALRDSGAKLGIENHDRLKASELASIMNSVGNSQVGICLDCVNSMGAGEGLEHVSRVLAPFTLNLHIKDFVTTRLPHKMGFSITGAVAGSGMTNLPMLLERIVPFGRCESAVLEQWVPPEPDLEKTIQKESIWAEAGIQYLRTLPVFSKYNKQTFICL